MTIRTQKPNRLRLWLRHIRTGSFQKSFLRIIIAVKNIGKKINFLCQKLTPKGSSSGKAQKIAEILNFRIKKTKIAKSPLLNHFVLRHLGVFVLVAIVIVSNFLTAKSSDIILQELISEISLSESAAVSERDLEGLVSRVAKYTPGIKENPKKVVDRLVLKDQVVMADGQYVIKPQVIVTSTNGGSAQAEQKSQSKPKQITSYQVQSGDTLSLIAKKFGVSVSTIKAANNLTSDYIKPGQKLTILPTDGIVHTVVRGETLSSIVVKYQGDLHKTIQENGLARADRIFAGQKIVVVGGKRPAPTRIASRSSTGSQSQVSGIKVRRGKGPNYFPFGWCTWYVASRRYIPWRGNAGTWSYQARRFGYQVGRTPAVGAILVTNESRWGHVAYVEAVHGSTVTISEMNFTRWGRVNRRTLPASYGVYIY